MNNFNAGDKVLLWVKTRKNWVRGFTVLSVDNNTVELFYDDTERVIKVDIEDVRYDVGELKLYVCIASSDMYPRLIVYQVWAISPHDAFKRMVRLCGNPAYLDDDEVLELYTCIREENESVLYTRAPLRNDVDPNRIECMLSPEIQHDVTRIFNRTLDY